MARINIRLKNFRIRGFRSCKDTTLNLEPQLTVLIGRNGTGKTNILHAMRLLHGAGLRRSGYVEGDVSTNQCEIESEYLVGRETILCRSSVIYKSTESNTDEVIYTKETWSFDQGENWKDLDEEFHGRRVYVGSAARTEFRYVSSDGYIAPRYFHTGAPEISTEDQKILKTIELIHRYRRRSVYYSASQFTNPTLCPTSFEIDDNGALRENYTNKSHIHMRFLHDLFKAFKRDHAAYSAYTDLISNKGVGLVESLEWKETNIATQAYEVRVGGNLIQKTRDRILVIPTVKIDGVKLSYNQLSEGTFRSLALLFYIVTNQNDLLLIEEPEVCIHHGLLNSMIDVIRSYAKGRQFVLSTHSESIVDHLTINELRLVTKTKKTGSTASSVADVLQADGIAALRSYLSGTGNLGEFWKHGGLE